MLLGAGRRARVRLGMAGVLLALVAVGCSGRVREQEAAQVRAPVADAPAVAAELPAPPPPLSDVVEPAVAPVVRPVPIQRQELRIPPGPTVLPGETPAPAPAVVHHALQGLGQIQIDRMGLNVPFFEGVDQGTLANGPGHWPDRALPGHVGNVVLAGHRVTHTHPFADIDKLQPGDLIVFTTNEGRFVYQMTDSLIVRPNDMWIADPTDTPTVTLFACHPKGSAAERYVVRGRLISTPVYDGASAASNGSAPPTDPPPQDAPPRRCTHILCIGG